ncbi:hypothetical protein L3Q82_008200 [Scortum barcoo]|uniref:Uncharacterized protein n=1 Tax=Scortum barcoo TaxID=214431 RepID=A0ACB8WH23_9TELE|nr:hypothetical protein L3Q82_008200 [Scortum barcoo]
MPVMSVPAQKPSTKRTGKRITYFNNQSVAMKETSQHPEGSYYVPSDTASDPGQSEAASTVTSNPQGPHMYLSSVIFSPDKGDQNRGHYQQTVPMKWAHQETSQQQPSLSQQQRAASWNPMGNWGQNIANYIGGVNVTDTRTQNAFVKSMHDTSGLQPHQQAPNRAAEKQPLGPNSAVEAYRDAVQARTGLDWEQQQSQAFQETLKPGALNPQQHSTSHPGGSSVLQPFQLAFGQPKQHLPAYYQTFQGNRTTLPNPPIYSTQAKPQHQLQQLQKQEQIQRQQQHHIIQQQIQQQHHQQMQQQQQQIIQHQQHVQQQLQQQQQQQKIQQQQQQQQQQQLQIQQMQHQQLQQQNPHVLDYYPAAQNAHPHPHSQPVVVHSLESSAPAPPNIQEPIIQDITPEPQQPSDPLPPPLQAELLSQSQPQTHLQSQAQLRRSRRLSKEGGAPSDNPFLPASSDQAAPGSQSSQNGARDIQAAPTGVIQSTRRKRRVSQEVNLETLAQKASEMESLPSHVVKEPHRPWSPPGSEGLNAKRPRDDSLLPLVIPVSVPVRRQEPASPDRDEAALASHWPPRPSNPQDLGRADHKPSVIVTRRRSLRNSLSESSEQNGGTEGEKDDDGKKSKRRPRPEPLFIPPPKPDSCDITPPVLSAMSEATPVSIEPRINIGSRYQAEVPELRQRSAVELDHHRAELVWAPLTELEEKADFQEREDTSSFNPAVENLMHLACSSVLCGGGTNQELAHHCLYECKGDIMAALSLLMLKNPIFSKSHHLANYHYSGSDSWTAAERRQFNKGITAYKKDFFMVQKQVITKSVAQCVEFYYTYKKHVKIGRNGTLTYGEAEPLENRTTEEETDHKQDSHRLEPQRDEDSRKWEGSADRKQDVVPTRVAQTLQCTENPGTVLIMKEDVGRDQPPSRVIHPPPPPRVTPPPSSKPRYEGNARRTSPSTGNKGSAGQEGEFPCKKCGRIFYKVKSRSAHMKSHAEQEKKAAAALRQKEAEERAAAKAAAEAAALLAARQQNGTRQMGGDSTNDDDSSDGQDEDDEDWH